MNATEMIDHLNSRLDALKIENDQMKAATAELLEAVDDLLFCLDVYCGDHCETEDSINHVRAAIAKHEELSK